MRAPKPRAVLGRIRWVVRQAVAFLRRSWRRSLHFRVVSFSALLGATVIALVGFLMYQSVADGFVRNKTNSAQQVALAETKVVQDAFDATDKTDLTTLTNVARDSVRRVSSPLDDASRRVIFERSEGNNKVGIQRISTIGTEGLAPAADIRASLAEDPTHQQTKLVTVTDAQDPRKTLPAVMVGSRITVPSAGNYDLYLIFPMDKETQALGVVQKSFGIGAFALILLLIGTAYLVTRLVVTPIRSAAGVAEKLAGGDLDERMPVRGSDDLARLAISFNAMASSLQRQIGQLEDLSTLQQRFTSDVSHELRTPLTTIRMAADIIADSRGDFPAYVARSSELLSRELDRFESLLADLLEISRFDAGRVVLDRQPTSVANLCEDVAEMHTQLADALGVRLVLDVAPDVVVPLDRRRIERILRNLVSNAIEHAEGKPVVVTLRRNASAVSVSVRDYGIGLKQGEAEKVFDRFWRADPARARTTGGTGLGLSISLEDAHLHEGWLEVWGAPGEGSCFRLTLPRVPGAPITASPGPLHPLASRVPKQIASGALMTSDPGVRMLAAYTPPATKPVSNSLPTTVDSQPAIDDEDGLS